MVLDEGAISYKVIIINPAGGLSVMATNPMVVKAFHPKQHYSNQTMRIHHLGTMNVCTNFTGNLSSSF